jgi:glycosyltransferase involved in cell wall biosynthesis
VAASDGRYERLGADLVHFPVQGFVRCALPSVYNPHDLQHRHYPQFFPPHTRAWRDATYAAGCRESRAVVVEAHWVRHDLVRQYAVDPAKISVIPMAPPTDLYGAVTESDLLEVRSRFRLPPAFALYPAQTWPHKNHLGLLRAVDLLRREHGTPLGLVCTGRQNDFWPRIEQEINALGLAGHVHFLGFVVPADLRALYRLAEFVVFPSLFEGGAFPLLEAFREGAPVACSAVTSLPEYAGDAALYFDPSSTESMAGAMRRLLGDPRLRATLRARAVARVGSFTWEQTAKRYRALYRKVAGRALSEEDRSLLAHDPLCVRPPELAPGPA